MRASSTEYPRWLVLNALLVAVIIVSGCSRTKYRLRADHDAYQVIDERNFDPCWAVTDYSIEMDPRSRYFDPYDPDHSPMPLDDPASHQYMRRVDGKKGWKHWHRNGDRFDLENPVWHAALAGYADVTEDGVLELDINSALQIAYINSPRNQFELETLYLSALGVTAERFRLDTQFFGGYDTRYAHVGGLNPPGFRFDPSTNSFVVEPAGLRNEQNRLTEGRPAFGVNASPFGLAGAVRKRTATAGEMLVGFANSFVWEFTGGDANLATSLVGFNIVQPLLRGAGRDIALESLTQSERDLLANLRAYSQFRQGFYTLIAIGDLGVTGTSPDGPSTTLTSFNGFGGAGGYLGLLQQTQQLRNLENNLSLQIRTRTRLEALLESEFIDLVQVDQFRQSVEDLRAELLSRRNVLQLSLDSYKTDTLGLPPNLPVELDEELIQQFQLFPESTTELQNAVLELQQRISKLPDEPEVAVLEQELDAASGLVDPVERLIETARDDLARMNQAAPSRERTMDDRARRRFQEDRDRLGARFVDLEIAYRTSVTSLERLRSGLSEDTRRRTARSLITWVGKYLQLVDRLSLVPAQAKLEVIIVDQFDLTAEDAFRIALENRLDFKNGRAALVDSWRQIQVDADALQAVLNVTANGDMRTARNNALSFRAPTSTLRLGLEFDAPFTRLLERNTYRSSLIAFQRNRRSYIQSRDQLQLGIRALLRDLEQLRQTLEIRRLSVSIAMRRVDQTQLSLNPPRQPPEPGTRPQVSPTTAINLLSAQTALLSNQDALLGIWLSHYATRMRLYREMGIMALDPDGVWIEFPIDDSEHEASEEEELPGVEELPAPLLNPAERIDFVNHEVPAQAPPSVRPADFSKPAGSPRIRRLPPTPEVSGREGDEPGR